MAEAVAAFYAVETAVEGAAIGAFAVSRPTNNHHLRFHKIRSPSPSLGRQFHSLNIVKGKAYIFGGDLQDGRSDDSVRCLTLPTDLALDDTDYRLIKSEAAPARPLAPYSDDNTATISSEGNDVPAARAAHAATSIDSDIYIFGGRPPSSQGVDQAKPTLLDESGVIYAFSTISNSWRTLHPHQTRCQQGVPQPRSHASFTSTPHPLPDKSLDINTTDHGTIFLHGGYDKDGKLLRDVWTFDVSSRVWGKWPDLPEPGPEDTAGEGQIVCMESKLWRAGDGFGTMMFLDILRDDTNDQWSKGELGVSPKTGEWEVLDFGTTAAANQDAEKGQGATSRADSLPLLRKYAGFLPITTGGGREYLLYFMGEDAPGSRVPDFWSFQVDAVKKSLASAKDSIRNTFGASSGENKWAKCEIPESSKDEGILERPDGLSGFAAATWNDHGAGTVVVWGGQTANGEVKNEGWVITVD